MRSIRIGVTVACMAAMLAALSADMARPQTNGDVGFYGQVGGEVLMASAVDSKVDAEGLYQVTLLPNIVELDAGNPVSVVSYSHLQSLDDRMGQTQSESRRLEPSVADLSDALYVEIDRANMLRRYDVLKNPILGRT